MCEEQSDKLKERVYGVAGDVQPCTCDTCSLATRFGRHREGRTVLQSHTYSGSCSRSLMAATAVLNVLGGGEGSGYDLGSVQHKGAILTTSLAQAAAKGKGWVQAQGQGLMWGLCVVSEGRSKSQIDNFMMLLREGCDRNEVLPYFVGGGVMITPLFDCEDETLKEIGTRLGKALEWAVERSNV